MNLLPRTNHRLSNCPTCELLRARVAKLEERLRYLEARPMLARAFAGERLVSRLVNGTPTIYNAAHDVTLDGNGTRLEVKFSSLSEAMRGAKTKRWTWHKPYGTSGKKEYDQLILVGEADPRMRAARPSRDPYVYFDIPFKRVREFLLPDCPIQISTDQRTARAPRAKILFTFLVTGMELEKRYGRWKQWND